MKSLKFNILLLAIIGLAASACNLEKEVDLNLPDYPIEPAVECYLEVGQPYQLLLTQSSGFFDPFEFDDPTSLLVDGATVVIEHQGVRDTLTEGIVLDPIFGKIYNYTSTTVVPPNYNQDFNLYIDDALGRSLMARAQIKQPIVIDSIRPRFNADETAAFILTYLQEPGNEVNYYRYLVAHPTIKADSTHDVAFDDPVINGESTAFGTPFYWVPGDTAIATIFNIEESYYQYLNSVEISVQANGNPFVVPTTIQSNIEGGMGIFTGIARTVESTIVPDP